MLLLATPPSRVRRVPIALGVALALVFTATGVPTLAQGTAQIVGTILDPDGRPAANFQVVLKDAQRGTEFTSGPSGPDGAYSVSVPVGSSYTLARILAPDGTSLPVQGIAPVRVDAAGTSRLDVAFQRQVPSPTNVAEDDDPDAAAKPWYKKTGGIVGIVLGIAVVAALVAGGGSDDEPASPSTR